MNETVKIHELSVDPHDDSYYRLLVNGEHFKYITIQPGLYAVDDMSWPTKLVPQLPPFPPGDWNLGLISKDTKTGRPCFEWTVRKLFGGVQDLWHPAKVDFLSLRLGKKLMPNVYEVTCCSFDSPVIAKFAAFPFEIEDIIKETRVYEWIEGQGIGPKFLGHLMEEGRVMGFLLEKVEGRHATVEDLPLCEAVVSKLHACNIVHNDLNKHNFLVSEARAVLLDFETAQKCVDLAELSQEMGSIERQLRSQSFQGGTRSANSISSA